MSSEFLSLSAGVTLSLAFSYIPGAKDWFAGLAPNYKRLVMLGSLLLVALGIFGLACLGRYDAITCDIDGAWQVGEVFLFAAIGSQGAYALTPKK